MPMTFANPTNDKAFKRLFGQEEHVEIAKAFLNQLLGLHGEHKISEITFANTENTPRFKDEKKSYIDIYCKDQSDREFIIEMQSEKEGAFKKRIQYYIAQGLSRQLTTLGDYGTLKPVIFIGVLNFHLLDKKKNTEVITHHKILNINTHEQDLDLMEFHFIELPKFKKTANELTTELDKWLFFLKEASDLDAIPQACAQSKMVKEAFGIMERATWSSADWKEYENRVNLERYWISQENDKQRAMQQHIENAERKTKDAERKIQDAEHIMQDADRKIQDAEHKVKQAERKIQDAKHKAEDAERKVQEAEQKVEEAEQKVEEVVRKFLSMGLSVEQVAAGAGVSIAQVKALSKKLK